MPAVPFAPHLPTVLLRLLLLVLPPLPFAPRPPPQPAPLTPNRFPCSHPDRPRPARRSQTTAAHIPLAPAKSAQTTPKPQPASDTPKHTPLHLKSFLEKTLTARETPQNAPHPTPHTSSPLTQSDQPQPKLVRPRSASFSLALWERVGGEGLPVEAPRVTPVVSAHRERPPNPAKTHSAAPQEFFGKNSYLRARHPIPTHPPPSRRCTLSPRTSTVTPESRS